MKRIARYTAVVGTAALLALGTSSSAYAATGTFVYHDASGKIRTLVDPVTGKCYNATGVGTTHNGTDATALLYAHANCVGTAVDDLSPGESHNEAGFKSVLFID